MKKGFTENGMIYMDNSAGSYPKPPAVAAAMEQALKLYGANPGRGSYGFSRATDAFVSRARERAAAFFGMSDPHRVIFTAGATAALNMLLFGLLKPNDKLLLTGMEHNSLLRPALVLKERGVWVEQLKGSREGETDAPAVKAALNGEKKPALAAITLGSNVCGSTADMSIMAAAAKRRIPVAADAAQYAGLLPLSLRRQGIAAAAIAPHKALYGPAGIGMLLLEGNTDPYPLLHGGTGFRSEEGHQPYEYPGRLEAGSINVPGIAGFLAGLDMVEDIGIATLHGKAMALTAQLAEMVGNISGIELYLPACPCWEKRLPVLALNIRGMDCSAVAAALDSRFGICVRSGMHCAPAAHRALGTVGGCLRFSPGWYNSTEDIERTAIALAQIAKGR